MNGSDRQYPKIKICGLSRECDIQYANELMPEYIGFVFAKKSRRYVSSEKAAELKAGLSDKITAVGVFVNEPAENVAKLLSAGIIDIAQLHGGEDEEYIRILRTLTDKPIIKAFRIASAADVSCAVRSSADYILLDNGEGGTGTSFDWSLIGKIDRPYFLAGGLNPENVRDIFSLNPINHKTNPAPFAVDVSSGVETDGYKDFDKMERFVYNIRSYIAIK